MPPPKAAAKLDANPFGAPPPETPDPNQEGNVATPPAATPPAAAPPVVEPAKPATTPAKIKVFKRVIFSERAGDADPVDVILGLNGKLFGCKRGVEVIAPEWVLRHADNSIIERFTVEPGKGRKSIGKIKRFNYIVLGDATEAQYDRQIKAGNSEWLAAQT